MGLTLGSICDGKVMTIAKYGAFVALGEGKTGMVHISEVAHSYVNDINDHLTEGQMVRVKIIGIDKEGKISLSMKKATPAPGPSSGTGKNAAQVVNNTPGPPSFEEKLKQFLQESESRISDLRQHMDKKGGSMRRGRSR